MTITKGDEVLIPYVDITETTSRRQSALESRYFFRCTCSECRQTSTCGQPDLQYSLHGTLSTLTASNCEEKGYRALERSAKAASTEEKISLLEETMGLFASHKDLYPYWRQPWPSVRHQMKLIAISQQDWPSALGHALKAYFYIEPTLYPTRWHPVRVVQTYVLLKLVMEVSYWTRAQGKDAKTQHISMTYELDWPVVAWELLQEVEADVGKSHGVDSAFAKDITGLKESGVPAGPYEAAVVEQEWRKLKQLANEIVA
ncbi:MAG: hypothetical protein LQ351_005931 [Letrouitia transgressa]|nr:MAG: hypothetical protein LQ351_005931 [Letrouitia transgressa]